MSIPYLLLARYRAIADKDKYIILALGGAWESFSNAVAHGIGATAIAIPIDEKIMSYAAGRLADEHILPVHATALSNLFGKGNVRLFTLLAFSADGESVSDTDALLRKFDVESLKGIVTAEDMSKAIVKLFKVLPVISDNVLESYDDAVGHSFQAIIMDADDVSIHWEMSKANAYAFRIKPLDADNVEIKTYATSKADSYRLIGIPNSFSISLTNADLTMRLFDVLQMSGKTEAENFTSANGRTLTVLPFGGISDEYAEAIASAITFAVTQTKGLSTSTSETDEYLNTFDAEPSVADEESHSESDANASLWYLPIMENNILKIRSVYYAAVTDGILEVI